MITLNFCPMSNMTDDIFTKAIPYPPLIKHSIGLGLIDISAFLLQDSQANHCDPIGLNTCYERLVAVFCI